MMAERGYFGPKYRESLRSAQFPKKIHKYSIRSFFKLGKHSFVEIFPAIQSIKIRLFLGNNIFTKNTCIFKRFQ